MYNINEWNENEKFSQNKIAQNVMNKTKDSHINTSCCIDTTKIASGPCTSVIQTSCCIDTNKE